MLVLCALMLVVDPVAAETPDGPDGVIPYKTSPDAKPVRGTASSTDGPRLEPGTYTDTISTGEKKYYRVELDAKSNAFVSTVLTPPPESEIGITDGIRISLESTDGVKCSNSADVTFRGGSARPIADYATRRIEANRACQRAGDYLYSVEWIGSDDGPGPDGWPIELKFMSEPGLKAGTVLPSAPSTWSSQAPEPSVSTAKSVSGGSGFNDALAVGQGSWKDELSPGESRFYRVPVEWGQQLFLDAEFANSTNDQPPLVIDGLRLALFNTARGFVKSTNVNYQGKPAVAALGMAPVAFSNRSSSQDATSAMRFSGWYYVRVSLDRRVDSALPMTLRVGIKGEPQPGPVYDGDATAAGFGITEEGQEAALPLRAIGIAGISVGTVLVLALAVWTAIARRQAPRGGPVPREG